MYELDVKIVEETNGSFALEYVQFYLTIPDRSSHFVCETGETDSPISDMDRMQVSCHVSQRERGERERERCGILRKTL